MIECIITTLREDKFVVSKPSDVIIVEAEASLILVFPRPEPDPMFGLLMQSQTRPDMSTFVRGEMG